MRGQDLGQHFTFASNHKALIFQRVASGLLDESCYIPIIQEKFIKPGDLRKHLQICEILRLEIFLCAFK